MTTTKDKLEFALVMGRHTRASLRQVQALMRYAGTLAQLAAWNNRALTIAEIRKQERIQMDVIAITAELELDLPVFAGAVLKIRGNSFGDEGIVVPA